MDLGKFVGRTGAALTSGALAAVLLLPGLGARADTAPPTPGTPVTVSSDVLPTVQIDGVVWKQLVVGNTVFVGGQFTRARPAGAPAGTQEVVRNNFLAYDLTTGALLPFAPSFNAQVRSLAVSPDQQRLYVGGQFTQAAGVDRYRIAAFDLASGALQTSFAVGTNATVYGIATTGSKVYLTGNFTTVNKDTRTNAAAVSAASGTVLPYAVTPAGGPIQHVVVSPDGSKVLLGGNFTSMNSSSDPGYGLAMTNADTGAMLALPVNSLIRNAGSTGAITSLASSGDSFYGSGYHFGGPGANLEGTFKASWASGQLTWVGDCHGDSYSIAPAVDDVYVAGHPHDCSDIGGFPNTKNPVNYYRAIALTSARTGTVTGTAPNFYDFRGQPAPSLLNWFPDLNAGSFTGQSQGPWNVAVSGSYVVYGGEFSTVNGVPQQGLVRFVRPTRAPNLDGPVDSGAAFNLSGGSAAGSGVTVNWRSDWDRDNTQLTYKIVRDGVVVGQLVRSSTFWSRPGLSYNDRTVVAGRSYGYVVTASDPFGNTRSSTKLTLTAG